MDQKQIDCYRCHRSTLATREAFPSLLHLLVALVTCGLWIVPWLLLSFVHTTKKYNCTVCGASHS